MNTIKSSLVLILSVLAPAGFAQTWIQTSAPTNNWSSVACSADGTKIVASATITNSDGYIYISTNSGGAWTKTSAQSIIGWRSVACSADGAVIVAAAADFYFSSGAIYTSTNSGGTWISNNVPNNIAWVSATCSADGSKLAAASPGTRFSSAGRVYSSTNSGATWTSNSLPNYAWRSIASSADGTRLIATSDDYIYASTNSGTTWTFIYSLYPLRSVACSPDGMKLVALTRGISTSLPKPPRIYVSTNQGQTWLPTVAPFLNWVSVVSVGDSEFVAASSEGWVFISTDSGMNWRANGGFYQNCSAIASSRDGSKLVATSDNGYYYVVGGGILTSAVPSPPSLNLAVSGQNMVVSWPWPSADFILQKNSDLSSPNWIDVTNTPAVMNQVILSPTGDSEFYRLEAR